MVTAKTAAATVTKMAARGAAGRMMAEQPERLAAAWRRERFTETGKRAVPDNLLDGCVEDFVRQIGQSLRGVNGPAWSRTRGVLRLSLVRGERALFEEFGALRRCLVDALQVVDADTTEHQMIVTSIDQAIDSARASLRRLENPALPAPKIAFGGLVIELIEAQPRPAAVVQASSAPVH